MSVSLLVCVNLVGFVNTLGQKKKDTLRGGRLFPIHYSTFIFIPLPLCYSLSELLFNLEGFFLSQILSALK